MSILASKPGFLDKESEEAALKGSIYDVANPRTQAQNRQMC